MIQCLTGSLCVGIIVIGSLCVGITGLYIVNRLWDMVESSWQWELEQQRLGTSSRPPQE